MTEEDGDTEQGEMWAKIVTGMSNSGKTVSDLASVYRSRTDFDVQAYLMDVNVYCPDSEEAEPVQTVHGFASSFEPPLMLNSHPELQAVINREGYLGFSNVRPMVSKEDAEEKLRLLKQHLLDEVFYVADSEDLSFEEDIEERFDSELEKFL